MKTLPCHRYFFLLCVLLAGCGPSANQPSGVEANNAEYEAVKSGYREVASKVKEAVGQSGAGITTFAQLSEQLRQRFPELKVTPQAANPFPDLLPAYSYQWLESWTNVKDRQNIPLIWSTIQSDNPTVLYITTTGDMRAEQAAVFHGLLKECQAQGAIVGAEVITPLE